MVLPLSQGTLPSYLACRCAARLAAWSPSAGLLGDLRPESWGPGPCFLRASLGAPHLHRLPPLWAAGSERNGPWSDAPCRSGRPAKTRDTRRPWGRDMKTKMGKGRTNMMKTSYTLAEPSNYICGKLADTTTPAQVVMFDKSVLSVSTWNASVRASTSTVKINK